ncbi:glutaminyl-peptide cyclotransferase [Mucilaginibacter arboris]|uniref:Glutaminyl-peptide cyclotransferase n=1 Tax=Mucilaginibacter arboris TaxID=2682090 RepID=A0A7K1SV10_9SPHI|nr:glutaminyl-peptide cyclotransferase [Mucilaginibacter arboris]MVN21166.1 glutaminyl-peptide cyclotransferase [Mucilaginibacter arboris]
MNKKIILLSFCTVLSLYACRNKTNNQEDNASLSINLEAGSNVSAGKDVLLQINAPQGYQVDSVVYQLDNNRLGAKKDLSAFTLKTDTLPLGIKQITATVYQGKSGTPVSTNIVLLAAKAPEELTYQVEKVFPHDTACYTEGLEYHNGFFYESGGDYGHSSLRKVDVATGRVLQSVKLNPLYFGEGITMISDKIIQLTYKEQIGFVYDAKTFKQLSTFSYTVGREGWGLCFDGKRILNTDGSNRIYFLDKNKYTLTGSIDVYDDKGQIDNLNELEYIDGKIYANVYTKDTILAINPKTGAVMQRIDMKNIYPMEQRPANTDPGNDVLNGIAYDAATNRIFVTGKKWGKLFQVKFMKKGV